MSRLPHALPIEPRGMFDAVVRVPGSKSLTNRALVIAALAEGTSQLSGALVSDDTTVMVESLHELGCGIELGPGAWRVQGLRGRLRRSPAPLKVGNSGTTARFLTAAATLADGPVVIDGSPRMRERPIEDLVRALVRLGARAEVLGQNGCPPVRVHGGGLRGGRAPIDASQSSQYVSAVLMVAPYARTDVHLECGYGLVSRPYIDLTLRIMRDFGAEAEWSGETSLRVAARRGYRGRAYEIEPDASAAVYPFCAAAIAGGRVRVEGLPSSSSQADLGLLEILGEMGCEVRRGPDWAEVRGPVGRLRGVDVDMNDLPDAALALAVVALFAHEPTTIRNIANLRIKETDRLKALETELRRLGARATADRDSLRIEPDRLRGAEIDTYDDHRMAMSFALAGLRVPDVVIKNPECVSKTWPDYFKMLAQL